MFSRKDGLELDAALLSPRSLLQVPIHDVPLVRLPPGREAAMVHLPMSKTWPLMTQVGILIGPKLVKYPMILPKGASLSKAGRSDTVCV